MCIAAVASTSQEISGKHQPIDDATFIKLSTLDANIVKVQETTAIRRHALPLGSTELNETSPPLLRRYATLAFT
jgi:hypothetical protein